MRQTQLRQIIAIAIEQQLSGRFYIILLSRINKEVAEMYRTMYVVGIITESDLRSRSIACLQNELQAVA